MARMLRKALLRKPALRRADLLNLMADQIAEDRRRRVKNERAFSLEQVEPALQLSISKGWLVETEGDFRLTREGNDLARRSRRRSHPHSGQDRLAMSNEPDLNGGQDADAPVPLGVRWRMPPAPRGPQSSRMKAIAGQFPNVGDSRPIKEASRA